MNFRISREGKEREDNSRIRLICRCFLRCRRVGRGKEWMKKGIGKLLEWYRRIVDIKINFILI